MKEYYNAGIITKKLFTKKYYLPLRHYIFLETFYRKLPHQQNSYIYKTRGL